MILTRLAVMMIAVIRAGRMEGLRSMIARAVSTKRGMKNRAVINYHWNKKDNQFKGYFEELVIMVLFDLFVSDFKFGRIM